ncbi:MAG TPA: MarR family transcriptional regulator [Trebonia sp.]|nr:MarR family transcriptional regulator [Trebonia sp.]
MREHDVADAKRCQVTQVRQQAGEAGGLVAPTVTRAATRMEAAGLPRREPHPGDRRLVRLRLTDRGRPLNRGRELPRSRLPVNLMRRAGQVPEPVPGGGRDATARSG